MKKFIGLDNLELFYTKLLLLLGLRDGEILSEALIRMDEKDKDLKEDLKVSIQKHKINWDDE